MLATYFNLLSNYPVNITELISQKLSGRQILSAIRSLLTKLSKVQNGYINCLLLMHGGASSCINMTWHMNKHNCNTIRDDTLYIS